MANDCFTFVNGQPGENAIDMDIFKSGRSKWFRFWVLSVGSWPIAPVDQSQLRSIQIPIAYSRLRTWPGQSASSNSK
jgi:hypothetical protein